MTSPSAQIILFDPPEPRRLRYLKTGYGSKTGESISPLDTQDVYGIGSRRKPVVGLNRIIFLLNDAKGQQRDIHRMDLRKPLSGQMPRKTHESTSRFTIFLAPFALALRRWQELMSCPFPGMAGLSVATSSSTIHQLSLRFQQLLDSPLDFRNTLHDPSVPLEVRSRNYARFWNTVWLILNDLLLGYCACELLKQFGPYLCTVIPWIFQRYTVDHVISALKWLDDWPIGLKLNTPLSRFFCLTFSLIVNFWGVPPILRTHLTAWTQITAFCGFGGLTLFLSIVRDTVALFTVHLRVCHEITHLFIKWQLSSLGGLWNLFRGKKWNVLRQRTDSYAYDVDQLFLGTLLFTVSAFLLPTVMTYAALFALIRGGLWVTDKLLEVIVRGLNAFPLFEVMLRIKEPSRLPHEVVFKMKPIPPGGSIATLQVVNSPKSFISIFRPSRSEHET